MKKLPHKNKDIQNGKNSAKADFRGPKIPSRCEFHIKHVAETLLGMELKFHTDWSKKTT